jgi:hypothetical protein
MIFEVQLPSSATVMQMQCAYVALTKNYQQTFEFCELKSVQLIANTHVIYVKSIIGSMPYITDGFRSADVKYPVSGSLEEIL